MNKLKTITAGILIAGTIAGGVVIDDRLIDKVELKALKKTMTKYEYRELRQKVANIALTDRLECVNMETGEILCDINAKRKNSKEGSLNIAWQNQQLYLEMLNKEAKECGDKMYPFKNKEDIRNLLKRFDEEGCPK